MEKSHKTLFIFHLWIKSINLSISVLKTETKTKCGLFLHFVAREEQQLQSGTLVRRFVDVTADERLWRSVRGPGEGIRLAQ